MGAKKKRLKKPSGTRVAASARKKAARKKASRKKASPKKVPAPSKKPARKKVSALLKKAVRKKPALKKVQRKKAARKKVTLKKVVSKKAVSKRTTAPSVAFAFPSSALVARSAQIAASKPAKPAKPSKPSKPVKTKAALALLAEAVKLGSLKALSAALGVPSRTISKWKTEGVPKSELAALTAVTETFREAAAQKSETAAAVKGLLPKALQLAHNVQGLARALLVTPKDIARWQATLKRGGKLPADVASDLQKFVRSQQASLEKTLAARKTFQELMKLARKRKLLTTYSDINKPRQGPRTVGWTWTKVFERELDTQLIEDIDVWLSSLPKAKGFKHWQILVHLSEYGEGQHIGYGPDPVQLGHPEEGDFVVEQRLGGRVYDSFTDARSDTIGALEDAGDGLYVFVHAVEVNTFNRRTEAERRAYESAQRKRRERQKKLREAMGVPSPTKKVRKR